MEILPSSHQPFRRNFILRYNVPVGVGDRDTVDCSVAAVDVNICIGVTVCGRS